MHAPLLICMHACTIHIIAVYTVFLPAFGLSILKVVNECMHAPLLFRMHACTVHDSIIWYIYCLAYIYCVLNVYAKPAFCPSSCLHHVALGQLGRAALRYQMPRFATQSFYRPKLQQSQPFPQPLPTPFSPLPAKPTSSSVLTTTPAAPVSQSIFEFTGEEAGPQICRTQSLLPRVQPAQPALSQSTLSSGLPRVCGPTLTRC